MMIKTKQPSVFVHDNVLPTSLVDALYEMTIAKQEPWGTYVTYETSPRLLDLHQPQQHK